MNLLVLFGAMPNCHGAGGLAGQYKFGARHGSSVVFLGSCKVLLAVLFGKYILIFLEHIPSAILGVMLVVSGQELASTGLQSLFAPLLSVGDPSSMGNALRSRMEITLITAIIIIGLKKTHVGALVGIVLDVVQRFRQTRLQSVVSASGSAPVYYDPVQTGNGGSN
jgi:MFS superfamily sulfate permease-like transporter